MNSRSARCASDHSVRRRPRVAGVRRLYRSRRADLRSASYRPLDNCDLVRAVLIVVLIARSAHRLAGSISTGAERRQRSSSEGIAEQAEEANGDAPSCRRQMKDALATLRRRRAAARATISTICPGTCIIGPPGSGKTTALVNSGLKFPLSRRRDAGGGRRRRRHALLRLVVHRGRGPDRHGRPLHHAGFRRQGRQAELARVPRPAEEEPAAPADQRRHGRDQPRGPADAEPGGDRRARRTRSARACSSCTSA